MIEDNFERERDETSSRYETFWEIILEITRLTKLLMELEEKK